MSLNVQFLTMAVMTGCGAALGFLFDAYRVISGEFRMPRRLLPPFDLLFWALATAAVFRALYLSNGGEVRLYVPLALLLGVSCYFAIFSGYCLRAMRFALRLAKRFVRLLQRLAAALIVRPLLGLWKLILAASGFFAAVSIFIGKLMLQLLYPVWKLTSRAANLAGSKLFRALRGTLRREGPSRISQILKRIGIRRKRK